MTTAQDPVYYFNPVHPVPDVGRVLDIRQRPAGGAVFGGSQGHEIAAREALHRYLLWRVWDPWQRPLVVIGLNPSTADDAIDDATIRRCVGYAKAWGLGALVMLNLFSLRSTDPKALYRYRDASPSLATGGATNDAFLLAYTRPDVAGLVLAAWGAHGALFKRGSMLARLLVAQGADLQCLGVTKEGHPKHPLYLRSDEQPRAYRVQP